MGELHHFLGMTIVQDQEKKSVWIGQPAYTENLLKKFGMQDCKPVSTISSKLMTATDEDLCIGQQLYQSAIGSMHDVSLCEHQTRHNLCCWQHSQILF